MSIPTVYIKGTKKQANEQLASGGIVRAVKYDLEGSTCVSLYEMPDAPSLSFGRK